MLLKNLEIDIQTGELVHTNVQKREIFFESLFWNSNNDWQLKT